MKPLSVQAPLFRSGLLVVVSVLSFCSKNGLFVVESFTLKRDAARCKVDREQSLQAFEATWINARRKSTSLFQQRQQARRWNGNYKHKSKKLSDVPKSKKLMLNLTANGVTKTLEKKRMETLQHVLTKAMIWKMFMSDYPNLEIELDIGDPDYLPDVIGATSKCYDNASIVFWGESGRMKVHKALDLMRRYPNAHIVHCRWAIDIESFMGPFVEYLETELFDEDTSWWKGKFSFASLPLEVWDFINEDTGTILIEKSDLSWRELDLSQLDFNRTSLDEDNI
ncbi:unnamed protein product [Pseudo-nitzschia multistriata]|uniref:Uncharacterized protein n=1 Tax=Pseudo-nitzschia multistriata TaxID=183589 RepID=A0A448Z9V0_9STRA|nr:unnamed protein product [Pseudo-nitzschia multistriata]